MDQAELADKYFWPKVAQGDGCWLWTGGVGNGYGALWGKWFGETRAHRISWLLHNGPIPSGMWVLHSCDIRLCVRPDHLWLGTPEENTQDMITKGRARRSPVPPEEILRWRALRSEGVSMPAIATTTEWSLPTVWRHLTASPPSP